METRRISSGRAVSRAWVLSLALAVGLAPAEDAFADAIDSSAATVKAADVSSPPRDPASSAPSDPAPGAPSDEPSSVPSDPALSAPPNQNSNGDPALLPWRRTQFRLPGTRTHSAVGVSFSGDSVHLFSCEGACSRGKAQLSLPIPEEARGLRRSEKIIALDAATPRVASTLSPEGAVQKLLWIRFGEDEYFSFLVQGAPAKSPGAPPRLLLKGWTNDESGLVVNTATSFPGEEILVRGPARPLLCGRLLPQWVKRFDVEKQRFVAARAAPLSESEKKQAAALRANPLILDKDDVLLRLHGVGGPTAHEATDGDRSAAWSEGHDFVELRSWDGGGPQARGIRRFIIQLEKAEADERKLWVATETQLFEVHLAGGHELQEVVLPDDTEGTCVAVIQPPEAHPIVELMGRTSIRGGNSLNVLVAQLNSRDPGQAGAALLLRGDAAAKALAQVYTRLTTEGRRRSEQLARHFVGKGGAYLDATIAAWGSPEAADRAVASLAVRGPAGVDAARSSLIELSSETGARLGAFLIEADPLAALSGALSLMNRRDAPGRAFGRDLILRVAGTREGEKQVADILASVAEKRVDLPRRAIVELGRVFGDRPEFSKALDDLCRSAQFEEAYVLTPVVVAQSAQQGSLLSCVQRWLAGEGIDGLSPQQRAALSVHVAETLIEAEAPLVDPGWGPRIMGLTASSGVRVRIAGLRLAQWRVQARGDDRGAELVSPELVRSVHQKLRKDAWPSVRSAAAEALGAIGGALQDEQARQEIDKVLSTRLKRDESEQVRRSIARAASRSGGQRVLVALRHALHGDASHLVRAEAALALGRLCDTQSLAELTRRAQNLATPMPDEDQVVLGLASLAALIQLNPPDIDARLAPLLSDAVPKMLRARVESRLFERSKENAACQAAPSAASIQ